MIGIKQIIAVLLWASLSTATATATAVAENWDVDEKHLPPGITKKDALSMLDPHPIRRPYDQSQLRWRAKTLTTEIIS